MPPTDSLVDELAEHRRSDWIWPDEEAVCDFCRHTWPCLVRRLADHRATSEARAERYRAALRIYARRDHWWQADHLDARFGGTRKVWAWGDYRDPWAMAAEALAPVAEPDAGGEHAAEHRPEAGEGADA